MGRMMLMRESQNNPPAPLNIVVPDDDVADVDLEQIRRNLSLTPAERLEQAQRWASFLEIIDIDTLIAALRATGLRKYVLTIRWLEIWKNEREQDAAFSDGGCETIP